MKVLITGGNGILAPWMAQAFDGHTVSTTTREDCDLTKLADVKYLMESVEPDVVIHCAAMTNVDECEKDQIKALEVNRDATYYVAKEMLYKAKLVYISTDMVYPDTDGPHVEGDTGPVNMYGRSKLSGEKSAAVNMRHLILRTNFFGPSHNTKRKSFSDWVLESLQDGSTPIFYNDVWWTPLHVKTLCSLVCGLVERDVVGIYNIGSKNGLSKAQFAQLLAKHKGLEEAFDSKVIGPAHFPTKRPHDMRLDCTKIQALGWPMPTLEEEIMKL